jgi:hypothetical protein
MIQSAIVNVSTTKALLSASGRMSGSKHAVLVTAPAGATLFLGGSDVTSASGYPLAAGTSITLDLDYSDEVYGILASGTGSANVLRSGA